MMELQARSDRESTASHESHTQNQSSPNGVMKGLSMNTNQQLSSTSSDEEFLKSLRLDTSSESSGYAVEKVVQTIPMRKPEKTSFVRVHPTHFLDVHMLEVKERQEVYVITAHAIDATLGMSVAVRLRLAITKQGTLFIWPIKLPREDRKTDAWSQSASDAASLAEEQWVRIVADMNLGAYQPYIAKGTIADPKWPSLSWPEILKIALRNKLIEGPDHPVIRELQGLA